MNAKIRTAFIVVIIFFTHNKYVKAQFSVDAELRPRFELRDGYRSPINDDMQPAFFISQRARIAFNYKSEKLELKLIPQDVRVWGDEQLTSSTGVYGDSAALDVHEAYAKINLTPGFSFKVGRQEFAYNNERLLARRNWNQNGLAYDAILFAYDKQNINIHLAASWNSLTEATSENVYLPERVKSLNFLWVNKNFTDKLNIALLHIASGCTETDSTNTLHFRQTTGLYSQYKSSGFNYRANVYFQYGKNNTNQTISAFLADADISYKFAKPTIGFGTGYLSGDNNTQDNTDKLFDVLYGARHRYFGHIDYFRNMTSHTKQGGLLDIYGYLAYKIFNNLSIKNTGHYFSLAQTNEITPTGKKLGYENELELKYSLSKNINIKAAYLFYLPTDNFKQMKSSDISNYQQFTFIEITINPTIFKQ